MKIEEAIKQSIKKYFEGERPSELETSTGKESKYTKDFFKSERNHFFNEDKDKKSGFDNLERDVSNENK